MGSVVGQQGVHWCVPEAPLPCYFKLQCYATGAKVAAKKLSSVQASTLAVHLNIRG